MKLITLGTGAGTPTKTRNNSSSVLVTSYGAYVIDAGCHLTSALIRKDIDLNIVRAVFITHFHEDHFGGLTSFLKSRMRDGITTKPSWRGIRPDIWLPDADAIEPYENLMAVQFRGRNKDRIVFRVIKPGLFFDDGFLKVTTVPNRHIPWQDGYLPSYCLVLETEGKKLVYTGDLSHSCSDFPVEAAADADLCVSELTHFDLMESVGYFQKIHPVKLVFNHVARANAERVPDFSKLVDYPVCVAEDGDEFDF